MDKLISQQAAIDTIKKRLFETAFNNVGIKQDVDKTLADVAENRLENWFDELPSAEPYTTTHDSIPAETGKNDGDGTSGDCISRQMAIDTLRKMQTYKLFAGDDMLLIDQAEAQTELMMLPSAQPDPCEDAVSREAVLSMIDTYMNKSVELHYLPTSDGIKKLISILPIVTPKLRKETSDLISRQAAIDAVGNMLRRKFGIGGDLAEITIAGLPSAQPENADCIYCHEDSDGYVMPLEKNCHAFIRFGMNGWELSLKANGWHGSAKIKYCPMCGRTLKNDK